MKKKLLLYLGSFIGVVFLGIVLFYVVVVYNYKGGFTYGTWINGVYCTNKSIDEVNKELVSRYPFKDVLISSNMYSDETIYLNDIDFDVDYLNGLSLLLNNQNPYLWFKNLSSSYIKSYVQPEISFDKDKLANCVDELEVINYYSPDNHYAVKINYGDNGYELYDNTRKVLKFDEVYSLVDSALYDNTDVFLDDSLFSDYKYTSEMVKVLDFWKVLSDYIKPRLTIDLGKEKVLIDSKLLSDFLVKDGNAFAYDEDKNLVYSKELIEQYVTDLITPYNTYCQPRDIVTHDGVEKHIANSIYGTLIDINTEKAYIYDAIINKSEEVHEPKYIKNGYVRGLDDIGSEYIEVDLTEQKLFYIKDNKLVMETDVVTGKPASPTPDMLCYINKKVRNAVLRGEDYVSPVDYWMAIYSTTIGLHDAKWQRKFGGTRYKTHGSHGCVNMPYDEVASLYDMVEVGIPVIVYK